MDDGAGYLVGVFPYLKTSERVRFRGLEFCGTDDLEGLEADEKADVEAIQTMFYLRDDYRIDKMAYCVVRFENSTDQRKWLVRLAEVQVLLAYLYSAPHGFDCRIAVHSEYASVYVFHKDPVNAFLVRPDENVVRMSDRPQSEPDVRGDVDGWVVERNGIETFWCERKSRIDPPLRQMYLYRYLDLFQNFVDGPRSGRNEHAIQLMESWYDEERSMEKVLPALEWYNRSTSELEEPALQVVNLAIAFESLLNLAQGPDLTRRFTEAVQLLLGRDWRLESWLKQFYDARSRLVHKGRPEELMFMVGPEGRKTAHRSLVAYGRHIFRSCVETILRGAALAQSIGLSSLLTTNHERFERICQVMDGDEGAAEKLKKISMDVYEIEQSRFVPDASLTAELQLSCVQKVVTAYLETGPEENDDVLKKLAAVRDIEARGNLLSKLEAIRALHEPVKETWPESFQPARVERQVTFQVIDTVWDALTLVYLHLAHPELPDVAGHDEVQEGEAAGE